MPFQNRAHHASFGFGVPSSGTPVPTHQSVYESKKPVDVAVLGNGELRAQREASKIGTAKIARGSDDETEHASAVGLQYRCLGSSHTNATMQVLNYKRRASLLPLDLTWPRALTWSDARE